MYTWYCEDSFDKRTTVSVWWLTTKFNLPLLLVLTTVICRLVVKVNREWAVASQVVGHTSVSLLCTAINIHISTTWDANAHSPIYLDNQPANHSTVNCSAGWLSTPLASQVVGLQILIASTEQVQIYSVTIHSRCQRPFPIKLYNQPAIHDVYNLWLYVQTCVYLP